MGDWEELKGRPRKAKRLPLWVERAVSQDAVAEIPDCDGNLVDEEDQDEHFRKFGIRVKTPHWVFV